MISPKVNAFASDYVNTILQTYNYTADRLLSDEILTLPYRFDEIKIKPNDIATAETFNISLTRLYDNLLYLLSNTKLSPPKDVNFFDRLSKPSNSSIKSNELPTSSDVTVSQVYTDNYRDDIDYSISIQKNNESDEHELRLWSSQSDEFRSGFIDNDASKKFIDLRGIAVDNTHHVYVLDGGEKNEAGIRKGGTLYRYNVIGLLESDPVQLEYKSTPGRKLHKYIGDPEVGEVVDKHRFNDPQYVICDGENIYVVDVEKDSSTGDDICTIKIYDTRLNWLQSVVLANCPQFKDIIIYNNTFLVLTGNDINVYNINLQLIKTFSLPQPEALSGEALFISASHVNDNIIYIIRERSIEKFYYSRLPDNIREYELYNYNTKTSTSIPERFVPEKKLVSSRADVLILVNDDRSNDEIHIRCLNKLIDLKNRFTPYYWEENENNLRKSMLYSTFDTQLYTLEDSLVKRDESVNSLVYNKSIAKLIYNHLLFIENVKGQFAIKQDNIIDLDGDSETLNDRKIIPEFVGIYYHIDDPIFSDGYTVTMDNYVHINEPFITSVFNRCLYEIYELQLHILKVVDVHDVYDGNVFSLEDILAAPCPGGIKSDVDDSFITDDGDCIIPDPPGEEDLCSKYAILASEGGYLMDHNNDCIIHSPDV